jgi:hypothetical protein
MMLENFGVSEDNWRAALDPARAQRGQPVAPPDFAFSEAPRYVGRAIVSLALDRDRKRWNQQSLSSGELARVYGFTNLDGTSPDIWQHKKMLKGISPAPATMRTTRTFRPTLAGYARLSERIQPRM